VARGCYAELMEDIGCCLMGISGAFAVGAMIGLTIIQNVANACDKGAWCFAVMWWAITAGAWTVVVGI